MQDDHCLFCGKQFHQSPRKYTLKCCSPSCAAKVAASVSVKTRKSSVDLDKAIALYKSGLSLKEVGIALGKSETAIYKQFKKHKVQRRSPVETRVRTKDADEMVELYEIMKLSIVDISNYFDDLCPETVRRVLMRSGVKVRSMREGVVLKTGSILTDDLIPVLLKRRYEEGLNCGVIARRFGVNPGMIKGFFARQRKQVANWVQMGRSRDEIAESLKTTSDIVAKMIEQMAANSA